MPACVAVLDINQLVAAGGVLLLFLLVARICRPRPPRPPLRATTVERHLVELVSEPSAHEAEATAAALRAEGVVALANAEPTPPDRHDPRWREQGHRYFVVVASADLERARALLAGVVPREGDATDEEVERLLAADADYDLAAGATASPSPLQQVLLVAYSLLRWGLLLAFAIVTVAIVRHLLRG
jgi:hypothetical protein